MKVVWGCEVMFYCIHTGSYRPDGKWTGTADVFLQNSRDAKMAKKIMDKKGGISAHNLEPVKSEVPAQPRRTTIFEKVLQW